MCQKVSDYHAISDPVKSLEFIEEDHHWIGR